LRLGLRFSGVAQSMTGGRDPHATHGDACSIMTN